MMKKLVRLVEFHVTEWLTAQNNINSIVYATFASNM